MIASTLRSAAHVLLNSEGTIARRETLDDGSAVLDSTSIHVIDPGGWDQRYNLSSPVVDYLKNEEPLSRRDSLYIVLPVTIIYAVIFFSGVVGNVSTCVVIARNKSMHTATNYYLFSLAISDLLLLISGLPPEMYYIWSHFPYVFGEVFCIIQSFAAETSANATVLTITAFTVERYVAICHPFVSHTMSKLSRAVKFVVAIWLLALCLAVPQAIQFGVVYDYAENGMVIGDSARCSTKWVLIEHAFQISTMLFFVLPMTVITVLYVLIAIKLRSSRVLTAGAKKYHLSGGANNCEPGRGKNAAQRNVIRMLVAVVVAFFICWAPFHAQRLLAVYAQSSTAEPQDALVIVYTVLTYVSGVFYYLSTTINPLLYNIMSNKFREAFKSMLSKHCGRRSRTFGSRRPTYSSTFKYQKSSIRRNYIDDHRRDSPSLSSDENQKFVNDRGTNGNESRGRKETIESSDEKPKEIMLKDQEVPLVSRTDDSRANNDVRANLDERPSRQSSDPRKLMTVAAIRKAPISEGNNNVATTRVDEYLLRVQRPSRALGLLAERLRFGTKELFAPQRKDPIETKAKVEVARYHVTPRFHSYPSIDSANTISNSSLQDLDETEFTGSELAHYMGELNFDLVA